MEPNRYLDPPRAAHKRSCPFPREWGGCDRQNEALSPGSLPQDVLGVFIQVEMAVEVDQMAPTSLRKIRSSSMPRSARSV